MTDENNLVAVAEEEHPVSERSYRIANIATAGVVCGIGVYLVATSFGYRIWDDTRPGPGFFPLCIGLVVLVLGAIWLVLSVTDRLVREDDSSTPDREGARNILLSIATVVVFGLVVEPLGFFLPFTLLLFILFVVVGRRRWWIALLVSVVMTAAITVLFRVVLSVPLPVSPIPGLNLIGV